MMFLDDCNLSANSGLGQKFKILNSKPHVVTSSYLDIDRDAVDLMET